MDAIDRASVTGSAFEMFHQLESRNKCPETQEKTASSIFIAKSRIRRRRTTLWPFRSESWTRTDNQERARALVQEVFDL
jgi:hypothetical protein